MGPEVVEIRFDFESGQADARHQPVHDDARGSKRRERSRIRAVADHDGHEEEGDARAPGGHHRHRRDERRRRDVAGAHRREDGREHEEHDRHHPAIAAAAADGMVRQAIERAVALRDREQQRDAGEGEEELRRKSAHHAGDGHAAHVHPDDPRKRNRQDADVQGRDAADEDGDGQRGDRQDS
jgi:hypothetical protein